MKALFPGSFNPVTNGHLSILKRASAIFSEIHIVVAGSGTKLNVLPIEKRVQFIETALLSIKDSCPNTRFLVRSWEGLIVNYAKENDCWVSLRGIRNASDLEYESNMATINRKLNGRFDTVFLKCEPELEYISSSAVREILRFGGDIRGFVPTAIETELKEISDAFKKN